MAEENINFDKEQESDLPVNNASEGIESGVDGIKKSDESFENKEEGIRDVEKLTSRKKSKFPTVGDIFALFGIYVFVSVVTSVILPFFGINLGSKNAAPQQLGYFIALFSLIVFSLSIVCFLIYRRIRGGQGRVVRYSLRGFNPTLLLWGIVLILAIGIVIEPLLIRFEMPDFSVGRGLWTILALCVFAPIFEEFLCRGILLESLRNRYGVWAALLVSSLFFAVMHFNSILTINAFFVGLVLAFVYIQSGSIFAPIILHAINNGIAYLMLASGNENMMLINILKENKNEYVIVYIFSVAVCLVSGYVMTKIMHKLHKEDKKVVV